MNYIHCLWIHNFVDEPVVLVSELDENRFETRKVEYWRDGRVNLADENTPENNVVQLGLYPIDSLEDINSDRQFYAVEITKEDFERHWSLALQHQ
jgi:hypothetical protein